MKRVPLKRKSRSELKKWGDKADRALQDWYRKEYRGKKCEGCGRRFQLMHHFIEKHLSAGLRFEHDNLIFLCSRCHTSHHLGGNAAVMAKVILCRGQEWLGDLLLLDRARKGMQNTVERFKEVYQKYGGKLSK